MISRRDVGGVGWDEVPLPEAPGWSFALRDCVVYQEDDYPAQRHRLAVRGTAYTQSRGSRFVQALVELYPPAWSARALDDVRGVLQACGRYQGGEKLMSHAIVEVDFIGERAEEALLVYSTEVRANAEPVEWWTAVVRRGDLVTTVTGKGLSDDEIRRIAVRAAAKAR